MAPQTRKSSARGHKNFLSDQLRPGLLGEIGDDTFLHSRTAAALFQVCIPTSLEKLSMICALLNKAPSRVALASGICQRPGVLGFPPSLVPRGSLAKVGAFFLQTFRNLRLVSTSKPRHIVIHLLTCSALAAVSRTRFSPKDHATVVLAQAWVLPITVPHFQVLAHRIDLCGGTALWSDRKLEQGDCPSP